MADSKGESSAGHEALEINTQGLIPQRTRSTSDPGPLYGDINPDNSSGSSTPPDQPQLRSWAIDVEDNVIRYPAVPRSRNDRRAMNQSNVDFAADYLERSRRAQDNELHHNDFPHRSVSLGSTTPTKPDNDVNAQDMIPQLNYVDWESFRSFYYSIDPDPWSRLNMVMDNVARNPRPGPKLIKKSKLKEKQSEAIFAVDVLLGEPITSNHIHTLRIPNHENDLRHQPLNKTEAAGNKHLPKQKVPGLCPVPDRIRINSSLIRQTLETILGRPLYDQPNRPVIMLRPYRMLVHYEKEIRASCHKLETKFNDSEGLNGEAVVNSTKVHGDIEYKTSAGNPDATKYDKLCSSTVALSHIRCLLEFIDNHILPRVKHVNDPNCQKIFFKDLWYLFKPGDEVVSDTGVQVFRVLGVNGAGHHSVIDPFHRSQSDDRPFSIDCVSIDFDGKLLGPVHRTFHINQFEGSKSVSSLPVYPFHFQTNPNVRQRLVQSHRSFPKHQDMKGLRETLISRGRLFLEMTGIKHMHYDGFTYDYKEEIDSQVVIDFEEAFTSGEGQAITMRAPFESKPGWRPKVMNLVGWSNDNRRAPEACNRDCCRHDDIHLDDYVDRERSQGFMDSLIPTDSSTMPSLAIYPRDLHEADESEHLVTDEEFLIMSHYVYGFIFQTRKFRKLDVMYLSQVHGSQSRIGEEQAYPHSRERAFDKLVLPPGHKEMVKSLIVQHFRDKQAATSDDDYSDLIRGKGKGLIILLHGAPGVGKTTTAECAADYFKRPLFQMTCGDLGVWASDVEKALETNFALASRWGSILLLDEADVFLASRSPTDHVRNSLVSVFLRVMEYYSGILFITTNRLGDFDEAFASRIHMSLYYPPLDLDSTTAVLGLNMNRIKNRFLRGGRKLNLNEGPICVFASEHWRNKPKARWNGRQIRNACQTALALAEFEAQGEDHEGVVDSTVTVNLEVKHFQAVANAYLGFVEYLKDIYGVHADERAQEQFLRAKNKEPETRHSTNPLLTRNVFPGARQLHTGGLGSHIPYQSTHESMSGTGQFNPPYYGQPMTAPLQQELHMQPTHNADEIPGLGRGWQSSTSSGPQPRFTESPLYHAQSLSQRPLQIPPWQHDRMWASYPVSMTTGEQSPRFGNTKNPAAQDQGQYPARVLSEGSRSNETNALGTSATQ
ncbi:hypothetical protein F5B20DRAFT_560864 [Whalleya microplaca]|nr:hypothetical protein F5B20DRAFT_560864 [Whalleya microplaca]